METILVVGSESVAGANIAAVTALQFKVSTLSLGKPVSIQGCASITLDSPGKILERTRPDRVVYCGAGARSCWQKPRIDSRELERVENWANAAAVNDARFTMLSSDGIFTGPWMFHSENSQSWCASPDGELLRKCEAAAMKADPHTLVVRTHAFGWSPDPSDQEGADQWIASLYAGRSTTESLAYASPILATNLADILARAWNAGLSGIYHIAGSERVSPSRFAEKLANEFATPFPAVHSIEAASTPPAGFGRGESSLQTRKIRRALVTPMPMLSDGLRELREQLANGYRNRLSVIDSAVTRAA